MYSAIVKVPKIMPPKAVKKRATIKIKKKISFKLQDRYQFQGLPISVENKAGSIRSSMPGEKPVWKIKMGYDYGYIRNTEASDGEAVDIYVSRKSEGKRENYHKGPNDPAIIDQDVYIVHQLKIWHSGKWHNGVCPDCEKHHTECKCPQHYDEDKVMLGFDSKEVAIKAYLKQYDSPRFLGPVSTYTIGEFKKVLKNSWGKKLPTKENKYEHWEGVDLDGTLAKDDGWKGINHIGEPVKKMKERIEKLLNQGKRVKIFTARAADKKAIQPVRDWLKENGLPLLEITNKKDPGMVNIYDDRATQVRKNTGNLIKSISQVYYVDFEKSFVKAHTRKGKTVGPYFTKRQPKAVKEKHTKERFYDHDKKSAGKAHNDLENKKDTHKVIIQALKDHHDKLTKEGTKEGEKGLSHHEKLSQLKSEIKNQETHIENHSRKQEHIKNRYKILEKQATKRPKRMLTLKRN